MLRSIGFIIAVNALGRGISPRSSRGEYPDLMNADYPVVLDVFVRSQLSKIKLYEFVQEWIFDSVGVQWCKVSVLAAIKRVDFNALIEGRAGHVG